MSEYDNSNRGAIWKNDEKESDNQPDFKGSLNVEGVDYWVSAWKRKEGANPKAPALSISIQAKDKAHEKGVKQAQAVVEDIDTSFDDDIPF